MMQTAGLLTQRFPTYLARDPLKRSKVYLWLLITGYGLSLYRNCEQFNQIVNFPCQAVSFVAVLKPTVKTSSISQEEKQKLEKSRKK